MSQSDTRPLDQLVALPTKLVAFGRDSLDQSFAILAANKTFLIAMGPGPWPGPS